MTLGPVYGLARVNGGRLQARFPNRAGADALDVWPNVSARRFPHRFRRAEERAVDQAENSIPPTSTAMHRQGLEPRTR